MKLPTGLVAIPKYKYKLTKIEVTMETKDLVICRDCKHFGQRLCGERIVGGWCFHWNGQTDSKGWCFLAEREGEQA